MRRSETGMSLIEATVILLFLMVLVGLITPSVKDYIEQSKAKARTTWNQTAVIAMLRNINQVQKEFARDCGDGYYAASLSDLWRAKGYTAGVPVMDGYIIVVLPVVWAEKGLSSCSDTLANLGLIPTLGPSLTVSKYVVLAFPNRYNGGDYLGTTESGGVFRDPQEPPLDFSGRQSSTAKLVP